MTQKKANVFRKSIIAFVLVICSISSIASLPVSAKTNSKSKSGKTSLGYTVKSTAKYSGKKTTGIGQVTNGGPCNITVYIWGFAKPAGKVVPASYNNQKSDEMTTYCKTGKSNAWNLCGAYCKSVFNSEKTVSIGVDRFIPQ